MPLPEETLGRTKKQLLAEINVLFGGRAGESLMMDDIATGAYSDIKRATEIAKLLITRVGMNDELGPINYEIDENNAKHTTNNTLRSKRRYNFVLDSFIHSNSFLNSTAPLSAPPSSGAT